LAIYVKCKEWHCLPNIGGYFDQDPDLMDSFDIISREVSKVETMEQKKAERNRRLNSFRRH